MRSSIVKRGLRYIFFASSHRGERVFSGYYRLRWYTDGVLHGKRADYALAAESIRCVHPLRLRDLPKSIQRIAKKWSRNFLLLDEKQTEGLVQTFNDRPDRTADYLQEIDRLERFSQFHTGYRCWNEKEPFTWETARRYLRPSRRLSTAALIPNRSPTNHWLCEDCGSLSMNKSLLKACPSCKAMGSLRPATTDEVKSRRSA